MNTSTPQETAHASPLAHELGAHFPELARFRSTKELEASPLYARLRPEVERVLNGVERGDFTRGRACEASNAGAIRATAWNVERGTRLEGVVRVLTEHPLMSESDVLLLTELDYGMARSGNLHVTRELARALGAAYAFAPCYINLSKGSGLESGAEGENGLALHGNAVLSRLPILRAWSVALPNGKDKMKGNEKRLGSQRAVVCDVEHPSGVLRAVSLHLDAHSSQRHRRRQMKVVLDFLETLEPRAPVLVGGDWNTSTYDSSRAVYSIAGFFRRVLMGVGNVMENHYLQPDRWFERGLFRELGARGFDFKELNEPGAGTLHYDVKDLAANTNMGEWVPRWCFWWIEWALRDHGGRCSLKLDWFAGRGLEPDSSNPPRVVGYLRGPSGEVLSDHDPVVLDFTLRAAREAVPSAKESR
ncbi:MAG TPA: endonuclease/exonuclease/phosphatase family protein [Pyrinomonadaceae bacterium]|nr:endonuclease/exonuclease/phosphatase family protein [Pyrinomonadaceae bacterium]